MSGPGWGEEDPALPTADELFATGPAPGPQDIQDALRRGMGEDVPAPPRRPDGPDVHQIAQDLGLA